MASIIEQVEKIPLKQRALVLAILVGLVGGLFWYFAYQPKSAEIETAQARLRNLESEVNNLRTIEAKNREFKQKIAELRSQLDAARQQLPGQREIEKMLDVLTAFGRETGVELSSFRPGSEVARDFYSEVPMSLSIRGPFHNIGMFLDKISDYPRIISVSNLSLSNAKEEEGYLMLSSSCVATTYRYVESK